MINVTNTEYNNKLPLHIRDICPSDTSMEMSLSESNSTLVMDLLPKHISFQSFCKQIYFTTQSKPTIEQLQLISRIPSFLSGSCQAIEQIWRLVPPLIFLIGTVGNLLSFLVLSKRSTFYPSSHIYLAFLSLVDEAVLCIGLMRRWIDRLIEVRLEDMHWLMCRLFQFVGVTTSYISVWIIVIITVERTLVIIFPLNTTHTHRISRSKIVMACLILVAICISMHFFVTVDLVSTNCPAEDDEKHWAISTCSNLTLPNSTHTNLTDIDGICDFKLKFKINGFQLLWTWIDATLYSYLPFLTITILNIIILINIRGATKKRANMICRPTSYTHALMEPRSRRSSPTLWNRLQNTFGARIHHSNANSHQTPSHHHHHNDNNNNIHGIQSSMTVSHHTKPKKSRVCLFCAQSFPVDRFHSPLTDPSSSLFNYSNPEYSSSQQHTWFQYPNPNHHSQRENLNLHYVSYKVNGLAVKTMKSSCSSTRSTPIMNNEMRQLTILLLLISGTFLITTTPVVIIKQLIGRVKTDNFYQMAIFDLCDCIAEMLMYVNHAANFYLYCAVGTKFRNELRKFLRCGRRPW